MLITKFSTSFIAVYMRITIGNYIKDEWSIDNGLFYFGISGQLGSLVGSIPMYLLVIIFGAFIAREPRQIYCIT